MLGPSLVLILAVTSNFEYSSGESRESALYAKVKSGVKSGFYGSRFGNIYNARDFVVQTTSAPALEHLEVSQIPDGVAAPHHQNSDHIKGLHEVPNVEEPVKQVEPAVKEELNLVRGAIKGGIKGGIKGVKGGIKTRYIGHAPTFAPETISTIQEIIPTTALPTRSNFGIKGLPPRIALYPNSGSFPTTYQPDIVITTYNPPATTANLIRGIKGIKKAIKRIKGGRKGYRFAGRSQKELFPLGQVSTLQTAAPTEAYVELTTAESYQPKILNLPTVRSIAEVTATERIFPTTEQYRQETVVPNFQQTELPYQQTELPVQQTELPVQQTELPVQQTELPVQQTELPVQQTELPVQQTELPVQQTELPVQQTEEPIVQQTEEPYIQQTIVPEVTTHREIEFTTPRVEITTINDYSQETQGPYEVHTTQGPIEEVQVTNRVSFHTEPPTTTELLDIQVTQHYDEPVVTPRPFKGIKGIKGRVHIKGVRPLDEFARYPLGLEGRHHGGYLGVGKGKGATKAEPRGQVVGGKRERDITVTYPGVSGLHTRRTLDPATPLLPSLLINS